MLEYLSKYHGLPKSKLIWLLFGMETLGPDRLSADEKQRLSKVASDYALLTKQLQEQMKEVNTIVGLEDREKAGLFKKILEGAQGYIGVPANEDVFDGFFAAASDLYESQLDTQSRKYRYLSQTKFSEYGQAIEAIMEYLYQLDIQNVVVLINFLQDPLRSEDTLILLSSSIRFDEYYEYLSTDHEPMTTESATKLIAIYHELSNTYAMQLRDLIGMLRLTRKKMASYKEVKGREHELARNVSELSNASRQFRILIHPFNRILRNAIAHVTYRPDYVERQITFVDRSKRLVIGYTDFARAVRELSSVVLMLSNIPLLAILCFCLALKETMQNLTRS